MPRPKPQERPESQPRRIETQIPRRKKGKAIPPLEPEWDESSKTAPTTLRMPSSQMRRQSGLPD